MKKLFILIPLLLILLYSCECEEVDIPYPYLINLPANFESNPDSSYSLVFYLHGAGGRGEDLEMLKGIGIPKEIEEGRQIPAIVVSPQAPIDEEIFCPDRLQRTLESIQNEYNVDPKRIYLTGLSMGGFGTWHWASEYPGNFAALLPLCGHSKTKYAEPIAHIPIWVFHGDMDEIAPISESQKMFDALIELGGSPEFTIYEGLGHNIWDTTYADPAFYDWMFAQSQ